LAQTQCKAGRGCDNNAILAENVIATTTCNAIVTLKHAVQLLAIRSQAGSDVNDYMTQFQTALLPGESKEESKSFRRR
jgi:hypothetical protein